MQMNPKKHSMIAISLMAILALSPVVTLAQASNTFIPCLASHGIRMAVTYQPASRYWALQWCETGAFLTLALGLGGLCFSRIRRPS